MTSLANKPHEWLISRAPGLKCSSSSSLIHPIYLRIETILLEDDFLEYLIGEVDLAERPGSGTEMGAKGGDLKSTILDSETSAMLRLCSVVAMFVFFPNVPFRLGFFEE
jgi:hypothetical protein